MREVLNTQTFTLKIRSTSSKSFKFLEAKKLVAKKPFLDILLLCIIEIETALPELHHLLYHEPAPNLQQQFERTPKGAQLRQIYWQEGRNFLQLPNLTWTTILLSPSSRSTRTNLTTSARSPNTVTESSCSSWMSNVWMDPKVIVNKLLQRRELADIIFLFQKSRLRFYASNQCKPHQPMTTRFFILQLYLLIWALSCIQTLEKEMLQNDESHFLKSSFTFRNNQNFHCLQNSTALKTTVRASCFSKIAKICFVVLRDVFGVSARPQNRFFFSK